MSQISKYPSLNQPIERLVSNDGIVVPPFFDGVALTWDVFVLGAGHINTTGSIALNSITINLDGGIADHYPTDAGVASPIAYALNVFGGSNINTAAPLLPANNIVRINLDDNVHIIGSFIADIDITAATGNIVATLGQVNAGTTMTAGTGITATTGDITATAGDIVATAGAVDAGTTVTAGTGITATTGNITATAGNVVITAGNLNLPNTNAAGTAGEITFGGFRWISNRGTDNTFVGDSSGNTATTSNQNVGVGAAALRAVTTGSDNVALGVTSMQLLTTGSNNVAVGSGSLFTVLTGTNNIAIGSGAGSDYNAAESSNICIGNDGTTGESNTINLGTDGNGLGEQTDCYIAGNTHVTRNLMLPNTNAAGTVGEITFGGNRWISNYGTQNAFFGALSGNTTLTVLNAIQNTSVGPLTLMSLTTGSQNTCVGFDSGTAISSGQANCAFGAGSLSNLTTTNNNCAFGISALTSLVSGANNIAVGFDAGLSYTTNESSNICIGNVGVLTESNVIHIGTQGGGAGQQNKAFFAGIRGVAQTTTDAGIVTISSDHQLGSLGSATNGQIAIGSTGLNPVLGTITAGTGISVTNGAGSITVNATGFGLSWSVEAVNMNAVVGHGYFANKVGRLDFTLPALSAIGDMISISGMQAAVGWRIVQGAGQTIHSSAFQTTTGVGGYLESTNIYDSVTIVCNIANTDWVVVSMNGNLTVV
jgi:hypothetical protein